MAMYEDGSEALFWNDAAECAEHCFNVLGNEPRRLRIAAAGHARLLRNGHYNEVIMQRILNETGLFGGPGDNTVCLANFQAWVEHCFE